MTTTRFLAGAMLAAVGVGMAPTAQPARAQTNDWPCVQRLIPSLEVGQMWSGPPLPALPTAPDAGVGALVHQLTDVHRAPESLAIDVQAFADGLPDAQRAERLTQLFGLVLGRLNSERTVLVDGIKRYARGQQRMAEKISTETREIEVLRKAPDSATTRIDELQTVRDWNTRVFTDRQRSLQLVCEQPVLLEQRAFAVARIIQDRLP